MMRILVSGGAGFIGSNFIQVMFKRYPDIEIINLDKLTYAGIMNNLCDLSNFNYKFIKGDTCDPGIVAKTIKGVDIVVHFAGESHVDRSINNSLTFVNTNVMGTNILLRYAMESDVDRFIHISTDEVYGSIGIGSFIETDRLNPSNPYSASKAGSDLLAMSYHSTYGMPVIITRCTNNFGPYQYPEKLIPKFITNLLQRKKIPIYGTGIYLRDWIFVEDHCLGLDFIMKYGHIGEIYNIGGGNERTNLDIAYRILEKLNLNDSMIEFVEDRKGHDMRYSLDCNKLKNLGWKPKCNFDESLEYTVEWYKENKWWWESLRR